MAKSWIGIDPGVQGFISVITDGEYVFFSLAEHNLVEVAEFIDNFKKKECHAILEDVHSVFGSSAGSTFNFGKIKGFLQGLLVAHKIPYTLVQPKEWQQEIWTNADMVVNVRKITQKNGKEVNRKETDTKATSTNAALRLFPSVDFRKNERCKKTDDNKVDALLMAEYGRRKNL